MSGPVDVLDTDTAAQSALRGGALRTGAYAIGMLISVVSAPLLIRHLGVADFGAYVTISALVTIISGFSDLGLTALGVREWAQTDPSGRRELLRDLLGARIGLTLVGVVGALGFAVAAGYDSQRLIGTTLACLALLILAVQLALIVPLAGQLRQGWVSAADLVRNLVQTAIVLTLIATGAGLTPILGATIPAALAALAVTLWPSRAYLVMPRLDPRAWSRLLRGTLAFAAASAVSVLYLRLTQLLVSVTATPRQTGEFGVAFRVLEILIAVPGLLTGALFPLLARAAVGDAGRLREGLARTWRVSAGVGATVAVLVATGAPLIVLVLADQRSGPAVDALRVLAAGLGCSFIGAIAQYGLLAAHEHRPILLINLAALITNAVLTLVLTPPFGAVGASVALGVCELLIAVASTVAVSRAVGGLGLGARLVPPVLAVAATGTIAALALTPVDTRLAAVVAPALAGAVALVVGAVPVDLVRQLVRRA